MHLLNALPQRLDPGATPTFAGLISATLTAPAATNLTLTSGLVGTNRVNFPDTLSASSAIAGAVTIGNGTAATNVAIGGGKVNIGDTTAGSAGAGALVVTGGLSAGNNGNASYFGGAVTVAGAVAITGNTATGKLISVGSSGGLSSYWDAANARGMQFGLYASLSESDTSGAFSFNSNAVLFDSANENSAGSYKRMDTGAASRIRNIFGTISLDTAVSSTPGSTITWVPQLTVNASTATFAGAVTAAVVTSTGAGYTNSGFQITNTSASPTTLLFLTNAGVTSIRDVTVAFDLFTITTLGAAAFAGTISPQQTGTAPSYVKGAIYFDTTLNKLRVGGATGWETITSV